MTRYWKDNHTENIVTAGDLPLPTTTHTEVQVVPLDAIVIRDDNRPEVRHAVGSAPSASGPVRSFVLNPTDTLESLVGDIAALSALHDYLREHPPVDEAQVVALASALVDENLTDPLRDVAERLVRAGWKK